MKIVTYIILLLISCSTIAGENNCAQMSLGNNDNPSPYAKEFIASYKEKVNSAPITHREALKIAQMYLKSKYQSKNNLSWDLINISGFWVVRFAPCADGVFGGAGMLLVSSQSKTVMHTLWER